MVSVQKENRINSDTVLANVIFYVVCSNVATYSRHYRLLQRNHVIQDSLDVYVISTDCNADLKRLLITQRFNFYRAVYFFDLSERWLVNAVKVISNLSNYFTP